MGRKPAIQGYLALNAASATTSQISSTSTVDLLDKASYHVLFSTANTGELRVDARNSATDAWYALDFGTLLTVTAETEVIVNINQINFTHFRLVWTPSVGAGTVTATLFAAAEGA